MPSIIVNNSVIQKKNIMSNSVFSIPGKKTNTPKRASKDDIGTMILKLLIPDSCHFFKLIRFLIIECVIKDVIKVNAIDTHENRTVAFKILI